MAKCKATTKSGAPCQAVADAKSGFCAFHDPAKTTALHNGRVNGGKAGKLATRATVTPWRGQAGAVDVLQSVAPAELVNLLCETIDDVRTGAIAPQIANSVGYLAGVIVKIQEHEALVERLSAIEEALRGRA